jgi:2,3-bisphosphoglycerate-dependent phosphoglycerate mutase
VYLFTARGFASAGKTIGMTTPNLVLIRHGRTAWNAERRFLGATDLPLDEVGQREAAGLGARWAGAFAAVYSSPLLRARQTAAVLAPPEARIVHDLRELAHGDLEGLDGATAIARHPEFFAAFRADPTDVRPPGADETFGALQRRALAAVRGIALAHPGERVAVVAHQMVIASVLCAVRGAPLSAWRDHGVPNVGAVEIDRSAL